MTTTTTEQAIRECDTVFTHSLLKTFLRCPREAMYKYQELLSPRLKTSNPLERGTWFHALLEAKYRVQMGEDVSVESVHRTLCTEYGDLLDEEKEALGDLPTEMRRLYNSYQWHYRKDTSWTIHDVELKIEAEFPNGLQFQGKVDLVIEDEWGLWAVDHKTHKSLPNADFRFRDKQSILYIWALRACGIPVQGFIWNYVVPTAPAPLKFKLKGGLYARQPLTDYPTTLRGLKEQGIDPKDPEIAPILEQLKQVRYTPGATQGSQLFRRDHLERHDDIVDRTLREAMHTAERYAQYEWEDRNSVERVNDRSCNWCSYRHICMAELIDVNPDQVRRRMYKKADPYAYYDEKSK